MQVSKKTFSSSITASSGVWAGHMSEEHFQRVSPLESRLLLAKMEIDDDDQDVVLVSVEISNESAIPVGGLEIFIQTSDKRKVESEEGITSLGPGLTRKFTFEFPLESGNWTFMIRSGSISLDLGPYDADFCFEAEEGRVVKNSIGAGLFSNAFGEDLGDFGNIEERGIIDSSEIKMTSYFGENAAGGATAISVGKAPEVEDDEVRTPPWKSNDPLLSTPPPVQENDLALNSVEPNIVEQTSQPVVEQETNSSDLLSFSKSLDSPNTDSSQQTVEDAPSSVITASTPPPLPIKTEIETVESSEDNEAVETVEKPSSPPSSPPSGPPSAKPSSPPSGPPSGPPSKGPKKPPKGPPNSKKPPRPPM
ncbi:MAG: hypothetical protein CMA92_04850 [Euryarchaeota archaeon]|nr:hypothetical protein [Euryarchaeota archaeon]